MIRCTCRDPVSPAVIEDLAQYLNDMYIISMCFRRYRECQGRRLTVTVDPENVAVKGTISLAAMVRGYLSFPQMNAPSRGVACRSLLLRSGC